MLPAGERVASLKVTNSDATPVSIRVQVLAWSQVDGEDRYTPTENALVSPPIFTVPAGGKQIVRVGIKDPRPATAYRVIAEEIPLQKPPGGQVQVLLRLNMPLYLLADRGKAEVAWRAWSAGDGSLMIEGRNNGNLHQQVTEIDLDQGGGQAVLSKQMGSILPASSRRWKIKSAPLLQPGAQLNLKIRSPSGDTQAHVLLEGR